VHGKWLYVWRSTRHLYQIFCIVPKHTCHQVWGRKEKKANAGELLQGWAKPKTLGRSKVLHIHNYATHNMTTTQPLLRWGFFNLMIYLKRTIVLHNYFFRNFEEQSKWWSSIGRCKKIADQRALMQRVLDHSLTGCQFSILNYTC